MTRPQANLNSSWTRDISEAWRVNTVSIFTSSYENREVRVKTTYVRLGRSIGKLIDRSVAK